MIVSTRPEATYNTLYQGRQVLDKNTKWQDNCNAMKLLYEVPQLHIDF